jgi:hypothetical protein
LPQTAESGRENSDARERFEYLVVLSEPDSANGARIARDATGIPAVGAALGTTGLVVLRKRAEPESGDGSGINYRVVVEYGIATSTGGGTGEPWTNYDQINRSMARYNTSKSTDLDGNGIINSAGDPIVGGLVFEEFNPVRVVRRFRKFANFNPEAAEACYGTINEAAFTLNPRRGIIQVPAKAALLRNFTCADGIWPSTGDYYYDITFELEIQQQVPIEYYYVTNKGWFYLDTTDGGTRKPYLTTLKVNGEDVSTHSETLLRTDGDIATAYQGLIWGGTPVTSDKRYDLQFRRRRVKDWSGWIT